MTLEKLEEYAKHGIKELVLPNFNCEEKQHCVFFVILLQSQLHTDQTNSDQHVAFLSGVLMTNTTINKLVMSSTKENNETFVSGFLFMDI